MKSISSFLAGFFILLLAGGFALGGINLTDLFGPNRTTIAEVGNDSISIHQYQRFHAYMRRIQEQSKKEAGEDFPYQVLQQLIQLHIYRQMLDNWGVEVSDAELKDYFLEQFTDKQGQFRRDIITFYRREFGFTDKEFELMLLDTKFRRLISQVPVVPPEEARFQWLAQNTSLRIRYLAVPDSALSKKLDGNVQITEAQIQKELQKRQSQKEQDKSAQNPKKLKQKIRQELKKEKEQEQREKLLRQWQKQAEKGASLKELAGQVGQPIQKSAPFNPGSPVKVKGKDDALSGLHSSLTFLQQINQALRQGQKARRQVYGPVAANRINYFFVLADKQLPQKEPAPEKIAQQRQVMNYRQIQKLYYNLVKDARNRREIKNYYNKFYKEEE